MANAEIGELEIELGGERYILRPEFRGLCEIENKTGKSVLEIARLFSQESVLLSHLVAVIYGGLIWKYDLTFDQVGEKIVSDGYVKFAPVAATFLSSGLVGSQKKSEKQ